MLKLAAALLLLLGALSCDAGTCKGKKTTVQINAGFFPDETDPDIYIKVIDGAFKAQTKVKYDNDLPSWYQKFTIPEATGEPLVFEAWDYDRKSERLVSSCSLESESSFWAKLCHLGGKNYVKVSIHC